MQDAIAGGAGTGGAASCRVVILGTGGTIAGVADDGDDRHYQAARLGVAQLVDAVPALSAVPLEVLQVAQVDSKDMGTAVWMPLLAALQAQLQRDDVGGVVITHGTDTLEETALLLHLLLRPEKPVVLTAAMRPASSLQADGPANLRDAVATVRWAAGRGQGGVVAVMAGCVWAASEVRKAHSHAIDAFDGGGAEPLARVDAVAVTPGPRAWPQPLGWASPSLPKAWPRVKLITSHADADAEAGELQSWLDTLAPTCPWAGVVVAGTGHGTVHQALWPVLQRCEAAGAVVWRSSRVARGGVQADSWEPGAANERRWAGVPHLTAAQARVLLTVALGCRHPVLPGVPVIDETA